MSAKQIVDSSATAAMLEQITALERKIKLMKQFVNPQTGTVDTANFANLWVSSNDCMQTLRDLTVKFL